MSSLRRNFSARFARTLAASFFALQASAGLLADDAKPGAGKEKDGLAILPGEIALHYVGQAQWLAVERRKGGLWTADLTDEAKFESSDPAVATVDEKGVVRAVGDGEATITAEAGGEKAKTKIKVAGTGEAHRWSFPLHIQPVLFKTGCNTGACHGAAAGKNGFRLSLRGYDNDLDLAALTRQANGRRLSLSEPEESLMLLKATMQVNHGGGERFAKGSEEYSRLHEWIGEGAPGARAGEKTLDRIEISPPSATLADAARQRLLVRAIYNDGTSEDVTRWVKFATTDESVAVVDDLGRATVKGSGACAITAYYSSKVTFARLIVPRAKPVPAETFASAERRNFIDDVVLKQLKSLQIAPAELCSDAEFIRRAYLDAMGILPSPDEVFRFAMDPSADKRAKLVDAILARDEFTDYWAYKWSDLFLLSSRKITRRAELIAFYDFIRDSVASNKAWDQFCREIVTAKGSTLENGGVNYFVMHKETVDLAETTSQAFLGMSITCARCHNHPLEKWTQDDYYGYANLLSQVKLKNGAGGRDTQLVVEDFGNIIHPRTGAIPEPKPLDGEAEAIDAAGDRRERLAAWMTSPENPYFTRAIVNRVWRNFMGRGLVEPEDDLRLTNPPSNEELMSALAKSLAEGKYDLRAFMRNIMNSAAYQRSSEAADPQAPDEIHYSQYIIRRLPAEVILDAYSQVTGVPTNFGGYPAGYRALQLPDSQVGSYFLGAFGRPTRTQTCSCERTQATSVAQTLHVANGDTLNNKLKDAASILGKISEKGDAEAIDEIYLRALARYPNDAERKGAAEILASVPREGDGWKERRREALEDVAWATLSGKEFLFNH